MPSQASQLPHLACIQTLYSTALRLEPHHKPIQVLLTPQQVTQAIRLGALDQRPDKYAIFAVALRI